MMKALVSGICVLLILAGVAGAAPVPVWRTSLENDTDITETGGVIFNGTATYVPGYFNNAFAGNGSVYGIWGNDEVAAIFDSVWDNAAGSTVDLYFYGENWDTLGFEEYESLWGVFKRFGGADGYYVIEVTEGGHLGLFYKDGYTGGGFNLVTDVIIENNTLYRLTVRQYGTTIEAYLDGGAYSNTTPAYSFTGFSGTVPFPPYYGGYGGRFMCVGSEYWFGAPLKSGSWVDEISVYNGYYTPSELPVPQDLLVAWGPNPGDGEENISVNTDLTWVAPIDANEAWTYDVYFGDTYPPAHLTTVSEPIVPHSVLGGSLSPGTYYWKVDSNDPNVASADPVREGDDWTFVAGVPKPTLNSPADGSGDWGLELQLDWTSDNTLGFIDHHTVILNNLTDGTSASTDIAAASDSVYLNDVNLWPIAFYGKDYTWQVIEVGTGGETLAVGDEWSFSTFALACNGLDPDADLTGDCKVTLDDIAIIGQSWLDCGWSLNANGDPIPYSEKDPCNF